MKKGKSKSSAMSNMCYSYSDEKCHVIIIAPTKERACELADQLIRDLESEERKDHDKKARVAYRLKIIDQRNRGFPVKYILTEGDGS